MSQEPLLTDPRVITTFMREPQLVASWQKQQDEKRYFRAQRHFLDEPIGIIPIEIFWQIFMHLASEWNDWAIVTQVCRYWRQAALAFPTLWTRISLPCNGAFFLLACTVPESRRLRVSVDLSESHWSDNQGFTRFQPLYSRIWAFDVVATTESHLSFWRHWKSARIPLEYLHMKIFYKQTGNVDWILGLNHRAPSTLQTLRISHCMVAWRMIGEICGLTELILEQPHKKPIGLPCLFEITCALRMHEKTLSRVVLDNCAPEFASDGPRESPDKAPLELRELVLSGDLRTCTLFLQSIRLSPATTVDLSRATPDAFHDANDRSNQEAIIA